MGRYGAIWMVNMVDRLRKRSEVDECVFKFNESSRAFLAQRCVNHRGRYLMIAQYEERRPKGVVMISEGANGEGWASVLQVFQAVVDSFVARDKTKRQTMIERNRQRMTYAEITTNSQTSKNANQRMLQLKERRNKVGDNEGHDICLNRAEIMTCAQELKAALDELLRLVGSGPEMEPMKLVRCHVWG
ncbi:Hypothetical predicted protein [Olea europaea subsp. europaea]|uniref:Uncharacterized protein n=1 Tax=Olea europaea subsp. europaea TaxID=158383 RepID=A0A8S0QX03_OLEEU|nr:Hypothetical predicted protein [Olea europaea subsp. europaea]